MTPFDLIIWALAASVAIVIVGIAVSLAVAIVKGVAAKGDRA